MKSVYVYYAKKVGEPDYMEEIVFEMDRALTAEEMKRLLAALEAKGMEFRREWKYNGEAPDFAGTVRV